MNAPRPKPLKGEGYEDVPTNLVRADAFGTPLGECKDHVRDKAYEGLRDMGRIVSDK